MNNARTAGDLREFIRHILTETDGLPNQIRAGFVAYGADTVEPLHSILKEGKKEGPGDGIDRVIFIRPSPLG